MLRISKPVLALDALSKLTKQFASHPDLEHLIQILVLTLSGQFSVPSAFISLRSPSSRSEAPVMFATGRYIRDDRIAQVARLAVHESAFVRNSQPHRLADINLDETQPNVIYKLSECGVELVAPLLHAGRLIGVLGLGPRASRKPFEDSEVELLTTIINTVTPLIANSFLFVEISMLNTWYLDILDNVKQGVFVFDSNFQLKKVNRSGHKLIEQFCSGESVHGDLIGMPIHHVFPEAVFTGWGRRLIKAKSERSGLLIENLVATSKDQESIFNVRVSHIRRESGVRSDIIVTVDDITSQKESEQRLFDLEKFAEKGVMASSISHELNNFLGMILGGVELTQIAASRANMAKVESSLEMLKGNVNQMKRFTAGLMDYTKLDTKKRIDDLNRVVNDVLSFIMVQRKFKSINITTDLDPSLPEFNLDQDQMAQLLLNLLNNGADAILEVGREQGEIQISTSIERDRVRLVVADNGVGMPEEVRSTIFRSRLTTKEGGHGYGLMTCARIIANHGGELEISSQPGEGTRFEFYFPLD